MTWSGERYLAHPEPSMVTTKTRVELVNAAMGKLMVVASGQSPAAEDQQTVDGHVDALFEQLRDDEICDVTDDAAIPAAWFDALASLLANVSAVDFGIAYSADVKTYWEGRLKRLISTRPTYQRLTPEYF
jgi:hypothetical protein